MFGMNTMGKLFFATLGAWVAGKIVNTKIRGSEEQIQAVKNALLASKRFQAELNKPGATIDSVIHKMNIKDMSAKEFERVFGVKWPL
jgi:hypothetical protein